MQHLAIMMDGNRRWAKKQGLAVAFTGHDKGTETVKTAIEFCLKKKIRYLSLYTLSLENLKRSPEEKEHLYKLLIDSFERDWLELEKHQIRVRFIGDTSLFPAHVLPVIEKVERDSAHHDALHLNLLFCYGAQQEVTDAVRRLALQVSQGTLDPNSITEQTINDALWTSGMPDPDLIIRTGGAHRLSNFLLFQSAYAELAFLDCYWPEITEGDLGQCYDNFEKTQRNFGK